MSTIPRRNQHLTDSRDREATRSMGASRDFTTLDGAPFGKVMGQLSPLATCS